MNFKKWGKQLSLPTRISKMVLTFPFFVPILQDSLPPSMKFIAMRKWVGKTTKYNAEIQKFTLTLHFYSPKAYQYVRKWMKLLSDPGTLRKWCCTVNCVPGFSEEIHTHLKRRKQKPICHLVIDEMSIRQQLILKNGKHMV